MFFILDKPIPVPVLPKFDDVFIPGPKVHPNPATNTRSERTHQFHNFWIQADMLHSNHSQGQSDPYREEEASSYSGYMVFFALMVVIDVVWFLHRMLKAVGVCNLILYGYPIYVDIRDKTGKNFCFLFLHVSLWIPGIIPLIKDGF